MLIFLFSINLVYGQSIPNLTVGYGDRYDSLPKLVFNTATLEDYRKAFSSNHIVNKTPAVERKNLVIPTGKGKLEFKKYSFSADQGDGFRGWAYKGYLPQLKMHILVSNHVSESLGFSDLVLLDSTNGSQHTIASIGDGAVEIPIPSPNGYFLTYYYNQVYTSNSCFIGILAVRKGKAPFRIKLSEYNSFETDNWAVEDIRWINNTTIIIKAYTLKKIDNENSKQFAYYIARLRQENNK
ncbi:hypothetical protein HS960_07865 [Sphingobacterium paramultivorum]|uniref:Uncharacterized protein n=1 Tax=Sphingobacterium paramultivorum TaxID=2886510 RepID=A0A7G5E0P9_9SPHI|nr:hypothetical protein [Sphingobacterium paramultivorum]QMV67574.1 hypothetical protein HS960_07865 [Sphingobacterium paramultivorum]WSO16450.1 hypothetical protein VUL84_07840 [Sphingobacterium paramultivorum]